MNRLSISRMISGLFSLAMLPLLGVDRTALVVDADTGISLPPAFDAELLYAVPKSQGSWVAMTFDPKGRLIVSDQDDKGVFRVTLPPKTDPAAGVAVESLKGFPYEPIEWGERRVGGALGFLYAFDSLYMSSMKGFYRIRDTDGDDQFDEFKLLRKLNVGWEHSAHSIIKTEDGKGLYLVSGNYTRVPDGASSRQPAVWAKDSLLESMPDPSGHAVSIKPPGGWVCRVSPDGEDWEMIASGFRNPVDLALSREGELFTFDSDLEFDIGCPWYRPTRVCHVTSAAEFGWRSGSAKWPAYFADGNGPVINVGPGSPTGISFGHHSRFPASYQDKLFICDWTFGTIYTVDLEASGSGFTGTKQEFLHGKPLNISAMRFGPDGHMYFLVGGRETESKLYRVSYTGKRERQGALEVTARPPLHELRRSLESHHTHQTNGSEVIEKAWPYLSHADRGIRYAARLAIENQPVALWQDKLIAETDARAIIHGAIALCRHGDTSRRGEVITKLGQVAAATLEREDCLALLRAYSLCFIRLGDPTAEEAARVIAGIDPCYPAEDDDVNAELCRVLAYLEAPSVVKKTIHLMRATKAGAAAYDREMLERHEYGAKIIRMMNNSPNRRNIHYAYALRNVREGWSEADRRYYLGWLNDTLRKNGGRSFSGYIREIRREAIEQLPADVSDSMADLLGDISAVDLSQLPIPAGPAGAWTVESALPLFSDGLQGRNFRNGEKMFSAGRCVACHRFQGSGGNAGPDLGSVGNRFSIRDILVAICEPSASISEQYQASIVTLDDGTALYGRLIDRNDKQIVVAPNAFNYGQRETAPADRVRTVEPSQISMMPAGTIAAMNRDEVMDLVAYLISGGDPKHQAFKQP